MTTATAAALALRTPRPDAPRVASHAGARPACRPARLTLLGGALLLAAAAHGLPKESFSPVPAPDTDQYRGHSFTTARQRGVADDGDGSANTEAWAVKRAAQIDTHNLSPKEAIQAITASLSRCAASPQAAPQDRLTIVHGIGPKAPKATQPTHTSLPSASPKKWSCNCISGPPAPPRAKKTETLYFGVAWYITHHIAYSNYFTKERTRPFERSTEQELYFNNTEFRALVVRVGGPDAASAESSQ